jgi:ribosome biogenesis GTPase
MATGFIAKALSGFYYVRPDETTDAEYIECRARGQFKLTGIHPLVGDRVVFEYGANQSGTVTEVIERRNSLVRPPIANINQVLLVFSARQPTPNWQLLDKFLVHTSQAGLTTHIVFSKCDLLTDSSTEEIELWHNMKQMYASIGYPIHEVSREQAHSIESLSSILDEGITVLAGQSGVGKSSLLNRIAPGLELHTAEISHKLGRGKHTTRHVQLYPIPNHNGWIADTPGFSQLDFFELAADQLTDTFHEFAEWQVQCKFRGCSHIHEPSCKVMEAVHTGTISTSRYESYCAFHREIKEMKRRY